MSKRADSNARLVYSTDGPVPPTPADPSDRAARVGGSGIRIRLDRRASDRLVTVVTGLPGAEAAVGALARELKTACGAGGTVKDGILELQGDHRDRVGGLLDARGLRWKRSGG